MTYNVLMGTLKPTHSLTHSVKRIFVKSVSYQYYCFLERLGAGPLSSSWLRYCMCLSRLIILLFFFLLTLELLLKVTSNYTIIITIFTLVTLQDNVHFNLLYVKHSSRSYLPNLRRKFLSIFSCDSKKTNKFLWTRCICSVTPSQRICGSAKMNRHPEQKTWLRLCRLLAIVMVVGRCVGWQWRWYGFGSTLPSFILVAPLRNSWSCGVRIRRGGVHTCSCHCVVVATSVCGATDRSLTCRQNCRCIFSPWPPILNTSLRVCSRMGDFEIACIAHTFISCILRKHLSTIIYPWKKSMLKSRSDNRRPSTVTFSK